jgi:hypothetical protein
LTYFHWTIFDTMVAAFGFFLPPTVLPVLAGLVSRRLSAAGALAGFGVGIGAGAAFLIFKLVCKPASLSAFQAASIVIPAGVTTLALVIAAYAFPARGEAAARAAAFFNRLAQPSIPTAESDVSPAPVAGLVIALMGVVLLVIGSGWLLPRAYTLTLGAGAGLVAVGGFLMRSRFFPTARKS